jgi:cellulose synthase (UDP-forming)
MIRRFVAFMLWTAASIVVIILVTLPISLQTHLIAGAAVVAAMMILKVLRPHDIWRLIALALGTSMVLRYAYWRTTSTLPPINQPQDFLPGALLYLAEMYSVGMLALSLFVVAMPLPSRRAPRLKDDELPPVDIFVPSYNEDRDLLARTLAAAKAIDYPAEKLTIFLLDDGGTEQKRDSDRFEEATAAQHRHADLQILCSELGVRYLTRARNEHAKAGNLNNGLAHSTSELVAVFDADHAPARDFLQCTVGFFSKQPRLFLVQTPHFFLNPDPIERNLRTFLKMPSENEMFYGVIQRGLDKWNASFFCGSAAVLRRTALAETNGFQGRSITEDCETALELHARGWSSVYVDRPLIAGLQPASFASFIVQRSRWAQGMIQILSFQKPYMKRGLKLSQRLCYLSSMLFWFFPVSRIIFLIAPLFYLFFDLEIFTSSGPEFLAYTSSYMAVNLMMQNYLYGEYRWPWISELYEYAQSLYLLPALISAMLNPSKPTFRVTAKSESVASDRLSEIAWPHFIFFLLLVAGVVMTAVRLIAEPYKVEVTLVVGSWNLFNLLLAGCALGVVSERGERQSSVRVPVRRRCEVLTDDGIFPAAIENVSANGAGIRIIAPDVKIFSLQVVNLRITPLGTIQGDPSLPCMVRHVTPSTGAAFVGVRYQPTAAVHFQLIADLLFANSEHWSAMQAARRVNPGVIRGTIWFVGLAASGMARGIFYIGRSRRARRATELNGQRAAEDSL